MVIRYTQAGTGRDPENVRFRLPVVYEGLYGKL